MENYNQAANGVNDLIAFKRLINPPGQHQGYCVNFSLVIMSLQNVFWSFFRAEYLVHNGFGILQQSCVYWND